MGTSYYFIGIITYPYKYEYGQYRVIFPYVSIWRLPVLRALTKTLLYTPIEEFNVYSLGNWAMSCCVTSDTLLFPLNLQYNSLPIEKAARVPYPPQSMYLILSIFTLLFYAVDHPCILTAVSNIQFGSIACTEYSNHYSISVSHYNSFSIYRNSFSTHSNIFDDRESELYVSFISKRSNVSVWERVTI